MNAPEPKANEVDICIFVDSYHAGSKVFADQEVASLLVLKEAVYS